MAAIIEIKNISSTVTNHTLLLIDYKSTICALQFDQY